MKWVVKTKDKIKEVALSSFVSIFYNLSDLLDKNEAIKEIINNLKLNINSKSLNVVIEPEL